jgi:DNA-binding HxlR family transcriptional regulator
MDPEPDPGAGPPRPAQPPNGTGISYRQAVEEAMRLLHGQWVAAVLTALAIRPLHFVDLLAEVNAIEEQVGRRTHERPLSGKVLSRTLQRMERDGLLARHQDPSPHPSVWYEITPAGRALLSALRPLAEWFQRHRPPDG